jgi:hypothetical protein
MERQHLLHVESLLDALTAAEPQAKFLKKFERGRRYCRDLFKGLPTPGKLDQVVILLSAGDKVRDFGGGRLVRRGAVQFAAPKNATACRRRHPFRRHPGDRVGPARRRGGEALLAEGRQRPDLGDRLARRLRPRRVEPGVRSP